MEFEIISIFTERRPNGNSRIVAKDLKSKKIYEIELKTELLKNKNFIKRTLTEAVAVEESNEFSYIQVGDII